ADSVPEGEYITSALRVIPLWNRSEVKEQCQEQEALPVHDQEVDKRQRPQCSSENEGCGASWGEPPLPAACHVFIVEHCHAHDRRGESIGVLGGRRQGQHEAGEQTARCTRSEPARRVEAEPNAE